MLRHAPAAAILPPGTGTRVKIIVHIKHVAWRDGRPRFLPGPKLRRLGYKGEDLKGADGSWLGLEATRAWAEARDAEIAGRRAAKASGTRLAPPRRAAVYTVEDLFDDLWTAQRFKVASGRGGLSPRTIADYAKKAKLFARFDPEFYTAPAAAVTRPIVKSLHEKLWEAKGLPMANGMVAVLRLAYSEALDRGRGGLVANPCLKLRLPTPAPRLRIATPAEIDALMAAADALDATVGDAIMLALYTGQRQGDVLALEERQESGGHIRFVQAKTGARVKVRALAPLLARLSAARARKRAPAKGETRVTTTIVVDPRTGAMVDEHRFRHQFALVRAQAAKACPGVATLWFADLRDTAVTRLALAGCTIPEIAAITGHSLDSIHGILKHYLELNEAHADAAIVKLEEWLSKEGIAL